MSEINFAALDKFRAAANYAQAIDNNPTGGGSVVIHLHDGEKLKCDYSRTDTPRSLSHFMFLRSGDEKRLNNETRALFKQTVIGIFGGNLSITGQVVFTGGLLLQFVNGDNISNKVTGNDGSFATYSGKISLSAADLDKLANADWEKLDMGPISEVDLNRNIDDRFKKAADMIPDDFKFTGSVDVTFNLHTDSLLDMSAIGA